MKKLRKYKWFVFGFFILLLVLLIWVAKDVFLANEGSIYGDRLEGIKDVPVADAVKKEVSAFLSSKAGVKKTEINLHGKIINVLIYVDDTMTVDTAKAISTESLAKFSEKIKGFYDISFLIDYYGKSENKIFPIIGYKNKANAQIVW